MERFKILIPKAIYEALQIKASKKKMGTVDYISKIIFANITKRKSVSILVMPKGECLQSCVRLDGEEAKKFKRFFQGLVISRNAIITSWLIEEVE